MKLKPIVLVLTWGLFASVAWSQNKSPLDLIPQIAEANNQDLSKLTFFEINILKNAIYSAKGYKYADDRQWLYEYFYRPRSKTTVPGSGPWDLSGYSFPDPASGVEFKFDPTMEKAIANIRVALYRKISSYPSVKEVDQAIDRDYNQHFQKGYFIILGRKIIRPTQEYKESIRREAHGYFNIAQLSQSDEAFDASELLGVYVGSVVLLKNIIEAKHGKIFDGITAWEITQRIGVTPQDQQYDEAKLPPEVKAKLQILDSVIKKISQSAIGDLPEQFKKGAITVDAYYEEGC